MDFPVPNLKEIDDTRSVQLCEELRRFLLHEISQTGGHLASNLGIVELMVALHRVFSFETDRIVFDVGHQCYCHKILSGRGGQFATMRSFGGLSGFPKPSESVQDAFIAGHASNSVSVALGMARARTLNKENYHVMALLGDGALTGGLAYEGLSDAGQSGEPMLVILNDNGMSITQNVGGVARHLAQQRLKPQYLRFKRGYRKVVSVLPGGGRFYRMTHRVKTAIKETLLPCSVFEDMGFTYMGPVDGHDVAALTRLLVYIKENLAGPVLLHVKTQKGRGYRFAEQNPDAFHGVSKFVVETGKPVKVSGENFSSVFGQTLCELAQRDPAICAITAAMQPGTGLSSFAQTYPERFFDVGIAEGHAVAMASGMAKQGAKPVFAVYSTFLQRSYDMLLHDMAIQNLPVVLGVDRAGLVGEDGETHHGLYDVGFLTTVPGLRLYAPANFAELRSMLTQALTHLNGPVAVRYPRGGEGAFREDTSARPWVWLRRGTDVILVTYGTLIDQVLEAAQALERQNYSVGVVKLNCLTEIDFTEDKEKFVAARCVAVVEEAAQAGGMGEKLALHLAQLGSLPRRYLSLNTGRGFVTHGSVAQLRNLCGLDAGSIQKRVEEALSSG